MLTGRTGYTIQSLNCVLRYFKIYYINGVQICVCFLDLFFGVFPKIRFPFLDAKKYRKYFDILYVDP